MDALPKSRVKAVAERACGKRAWLCVLLISGFATIAYNIDHIHALCREMSRSIRAGFTAEPFFAHGVNHDGQV